MKPFGVKVACIEPGFFKTNVTDIVAVKSSLRKLWDRLPQEVKDDYGQNFLESCKIPEYFSYECCWIYLTFFIFGNHI